MTNKNFSAIFQDNLYDLKNTDEALNDFLSENQENTGAHEIVTLLYSLKMPHFSNAIKKISCSYDNEKNELHTKIYFIGNNEPNFIFKTFINNNDNISFKFGSKKPISQEKALFKIFDYMKNYYIENFSLCNNINYEFPNDTVNGFLTLSFNYITTQVTSELIEQVTRNTELMRNQYFTPGERKHVRESLDRIAKMMEEYKKLCLLINNGISGYCPVFYTVEENLFLSNTKLGLKIHTRTLNEARDMIVFQNPNGLEWLICALSKNEIGETNFNVITRGTTEEELVENFIIEASKEYYPVFIESQKNTNFVYN